MASGRVGCRGICLPPPKKKKDRKMLRICHFCHFSNIPQRAEQKYWTLPAGIHPLHLRWCSVKSNELIWIMLTFTAKSHRGDLVVSGPPGGTCVLNQTTKHQSGIDLFFLWFQVFGARSQVGASHPLRLRSFGSHAGGGSVPFRFISI